MTRRASRLLAIAMLAAALAAIAIPAAAQDDDPPDAGPHPGAIGAPVAPLSEKRVYDMANLLTNGQEASIEADAARLTRHGVPVVVLVQLAAMTPAEAGTFAADVRRQWSVESGPGADDGLVMLVTIDDLGQRRGIVTTMSWGEHALPHFGITAATAARIQRDWLDRYIDGGYLYEGILFSLRRLIYHSIYDPAPQEALTGIRAGLGAVMSVAGLALALGALLRAGWRRTWKTTRRGVAGTAGRALTWAAPALAAAVFGLSVLSHSGWGIVGALVLLGVAAVDWSARDPRRATAGRTAP